jgi:hypothetical protein
MVVTEKGCLLVFLGRERERERDRERERERKETAAYRIGHDDGADHAGAEVALLARGDVIL